MKICQDCHQKSFYHFQNWLEELVNYLLPPLPKKILPKSAGRHFDILLTKLFGFFGLAKFCDDFCRNDIQPRSYFFIEEARKKGIKFKVLRGPFGFTNHFQMVLNNKTFYFEGLPRLEFRDWLGSRLIDDKAAVKIRLQKTGLPAAEGKHFWFFQKRNACYCALKLGFPLVVKPRSGSLSHHVFTDIRDIRELKLAIKNVLKYSPVFLIEKFIPRTSVYRATVLDYDKIFVVQQVPANVIGDGRHSIGELIERKNQDPRRGEIGQKGLGLYKLAINDVSKNLLKERGYDFSSIPKKDEAIYLQKDPFLRLGADLIEATNVVHPDNLRLFQAIAKLFDIRLVGIDFLSEDIGRSWKNQTSAVLELNSLPCIEMHYFPSGGQAQNIGQALTELVLRHYF